jgi:hypothetical protein
MFYAGAAYAFHPPRTIGSEAVSVAMSRHAAALFAGIESRGGPLVLGADAAIGLDDTIRGPARTSVNFAPTASDVHVGPTFALRLHGRWYIPNGYGLALDVAPVLELAPSDRAMVVEGASQTALLSPALARFRLDVGGTFDGF